MAFFVYAKPFENGTFEADNIKMDNTYLQNSSVKWMLMLPAALISGLFFSLIAWLLVLLGVQTIGYSWQELLFYPVLCFLGLLVYHFLNVSFPNNDLEKFSLSFSNLLLGIGTGMLFFTYTKWLSLFAFLPLLLLLFYVEYVNKLRFMYRFYRAYFAGLLVFYLAYTMLIHYQFISYQAEETMKLNIGSIPFECYFYFMGMLLSGIYLFELFKSKNGKYGTAGL